MCFLSSNSSFILLRLLHYIVFQIIRETITFMLHSSSKAINTSVYITNLKKLNLKHVLIRSFEHWVRSTDNQNIARAVPIDLTKLTDSLLHILHVSIYFYLKRTRQYLTLNTKKTCVPFIRLGFISFKATGLLKSGSLPLNINFQGILITYFMGFSSFKG